MTTPTFQDLERVIQRIQELALAAALRKYDELGAAVANEAHHAREILIDLEEAERLRHG